MMTIFYTACVVRWNRVLMSSRNAAGRRVNMITNHIRMLSNSSEDVLLEVKGSVGLITLNRPKALNSLDLGMVRKIHPALMDWERDENIGAIVIKGAGDKAFCAGGDVRAVAEEGISGTGGTLRRDFFKEEYQLNNAIGTLKTPYVALIDGITMGGGVGLSVHGHFRVGTERTLFAMPETAIGFFPDVGGSFFLPKLQGELGTFLALTGERLRGYDVHHAGVATHYVSSDKISELEESMLAMERPTLKTILEMIENITKRQSVSKITTDFSLSPYLEIINRCFAKESMEDILYELEKEGTDWAMSKIDTINSMSPTSLKVTLKHVREGAKLRTLFECLIMEYRLSQRFMNDKDFYEGIRAVLIDKDQQPKWNPSTLRAVTTEKVDSYFANLGENELEF
ncbi:3-hydroxyisobutyryl-CoA hydrolase, mitochondrial-like [Dendronephthya gigantea]|uniref:3-hydroxyisobutyryl-CoA hydrolase, mitochondrial-like n=1 Tax=Dendronephthya gigantea TaxID=151771 RepID=UPI0010697A5D|nr:3-hydroxyisobutyryl-CoA hydrolase, mitochondrial-like [Dendronephthya gigantea]